MSTYISSNANRFYVALETSYGQAQAITPMSRFPAVKLHVQQVLERSRRQDKTGTRTFLGSSKNARRQTAFETRTYLTSWSGLEQPRYGPLVQSALGASPEINSGLAVAVVSSSTQFQTTTPHGLQNGSAISYSNEIRFVNTVVDSSTVVINAPFTSMLYPGSLLSPVITYRLATNLPSVSLYDYWDPVSSVSRIVTGAAVDTLQVSVNGDFHELIFSGPAADLLDSSSFVSGMAGLVNYPTEPMLSGFDYSIVPGHLGQVWLGSTANQFFTLTEASIEIKNNINVRNQEYGSSYPTSVSPGVRQVAAQLTLFAQDDSQTTALYTAAKQRSPVPAMLQLGLQQGEIMGIFLPNVMPEIPIYDDSETRLQWQFKNNLAQGVADDEVFIAFA